MIFLLDNGTFDSFNYNRWTVNPADMVGDNMLRDLQQSGLFRAVFSYHTPDEGRYVVQGGVEDFFLKMGKTGRTAVAALVITLEDTKQHAATRRILYQKKYREERLLGTPTAEGYCRAMSLALEALSRRITTDIYAGIINAEKC